MQEFFEKIILQNMQMQTKRRKSSKKTGKYADNAQKI